MKRKGITKMRILSSFADIKEQHMAVRDSVGWYDFTHHLVEVTGKDASIFLDMIYSNGIAKAKVGRAKYTTMLDDDGTIHDDVVVFRLEDQKFWVSTLYVARLLDWYDRRKGEYDVNYSCITEAWTMYSVQGPKSKEMVNSILAEDVEDQKFFEIRDNKIGDIPVKVARGGYTGEKWGYEIYFAPEQEEAVDSLLTEKGTALGGKKVTDVDVRAMTLPAEGGFILMLDVYGTNPFEVGLEGMIEWDKDFVGKAALEKVKAEGPKRKLFKFTVPGEPLIYGGPKGTVVEKEGVTVGKVTKFAYGFALEKGIGYALVDLDKAKAGDKVIINNLETVLEEK